MYQIEGTDKVLAQFDLSREIASECITDLRAWYDIPPGQALPDETLDEATQHAAEYCGHFPFQTGQGRRTLRAAMDFLDHWMREQG